MNVTDEEIAAFADDELEGDRKAAVAAAIASEPALARKVEQHRALRAMLGSHFAPILQDDVPAQLKGLLETRGHVVDFRKAKEKRDKAGAIRWGWLAVPALAASLAIAVFLPRGAEAPEGYARTDLAKALETQLAAAQEPDAPTRILLSFSNEDGQYCRAFSSRESSGIACRDEAGWVLVKQGAGLAPNSGEFRQAGSSEGDLLEAAQELAEGPALDADAESRAMQSGWGLD